MDVRDAAAQIAEIRQHLIRTTVFRGYRSATTGFTALAAILAASVQANFISHRDHSSVLYLWLFTATISLLVVGVEMTWRAFLRADAMQRETTRSAISLFIPCLVAGALLTYVIEENISNAFWMLPGLWAVLFAMGLFASRPVLPRGVTIVAGYYLLAGLGSLVWCSETRAFSPWCMAICFGVGQALAAAVLYCSLEREHAHG